VSGEVATLIYDIIQDVRARRPDRPALVGVAGAQGSGKTTVCKLLEAANRPRFAYFSLDDVYWPKNQREQLAKRAHPLFITRGPPATHDISLARHTIAELNQAATDSETPLPRFDKATDDPAPRGDWPVYHGRPEAILVDGWCLGALAPKPSKPHNAVERIDSSGVWRETQDDFLNHVYGVLFKQFDAIVYLRPPSWEIVFQWRLQQEAQLLGRALTDEERAKLERFVLHYERVTRSMMDGAHMAGWVVQLDEARNVVSVANLTTSPP
jgi:D-glycerate 3-kinase